MKLLIRLFLILFGATIGLLLTVFILFLLRFDQGTRPVPYKPEKFAFIAPYQEHHQAGWQLKPGNYKLILDGKKTPTTVTSWPDGSRATSDKGNVETADLKNLFFSGDSYVFGEGLSDEEKIPWQVQSILADRMVKNFGVG